MINSSTYPLISHNIINNNGQCIKSTFLLKGFLKDSSTIFITNKQNLNTSLSGTIKNKPNGFISEILFHGFNFSAKRIKLFRQKFYVDTHKSEMFICMEPVTTTIKSRIHKRRLIFFSFDNDILYKIQKLIKQFKIPDAYTGKGLYEREDSYIIKKRKKRK